MMTIPIVEHTQYKKYLYRYIVELPPIRFPTFRTRLPFA